MPENNLTITVWYSDRCGDPKNCLYSHEGTSADTKALKRFFSFDHVFTQFSENRRHTDNFICANTVPFDCDNEHTDDPAGWIWPENIPGLLPGVRCVTYTSRHNMKPKGDRSARPRFHVIFGIEPVESPEEYVDDVTTEKLTSVLADNDGRAAILSTEGGIFDTLAGIYTKNVNIDVLLKGYSGDCIKVDRIGRGSESIMDPTLTILLMAQPSVLSGLMKNSTFRGRGLTARFLYCIPKSYVGQRKYWSTPVPDEIYQAYENTIRNMLEEEYPKTPEIITLSQEAAELIGQFAEELEPKLRQEYAEISDWAGKLVGNTHRIAGLLCRASVLRSPAFLGDPEPLVIDAKTMANAIRIARYFIEHAKAAFSLMGADTTVKQSQMVLSAIQAAGLVEFSRRDIMRLCRSFKRADDVQPVLDLLTDYGYIAVKEASPYSGKGRPPAQTYLVNPYVYAENATS